MASVLPRLKGRFRIALIDAYENPEFARFVRQAGLEPISLGRAPARKFVGGQGRVFLRPARLLQRAPWMFLTAWRLRHWIRQNRPDVLYFTRLALVRFFGRLMPRNGPPMVYHAHGFGSAQDVGRRTARLISRRFARVMAVSKITAGFLIDAGVNAEKVTVVYNGVDAEAIRHRASQPGPPLPVRSPGAVVFVHVATVIPHKAQHIGIEALGLLRGRAEADLWLCGGSPAHDSSYEDSLRARVRELGLEGRVHFLGWRDDVPRVVAAGDVAILPSLYDHESFGLALAEAMVLGKPCIGSTKGGLPEVVEDGLTGLICPLEPAATAEAMLQLASDPGLRRRMGQAGTARAERLFGLDRQAEDIAAILDEVIRESRAEGR